MNIEAAQQQIPESAWSNTLSVDIRRSYHSRIRIQVQTVKNTPFPFDPDDVEPNEQDFLAAKASMQTLLDNMTPNELRMLSRVLAETI